MWRVGLIICFLCAVVPVGRCAWGSDDTIYAGLEPTRISPQLKSYLETMEAMRQRWEKEVGEFAQSFDTIERMQETQHTLELAQGTLKQAKDKALAAVRMSQSYREAVADYGRAEQELRDAGDDTDARARAAQHKLTAKARLRQMEADADDKDPDVLAAEKQVEADTTACQSELTHLKSATTTREKLRPFYYGIRMSLGLGDAEDGDMDTTLLLGPRKVAAGYGDSVAEARDAQRTLAAIRTAKGKFRDPKYYPALTLRIMGADDRGVGGTASFGPPGRMGYITDAELESSNDSSVIVQWQLETLQISGLDVANLRTVTETEPPNTVIVIQKLVVVQDEKRYADGRIVCDVKVFDPEAEIRSAKAAQAAQRSPDTPNTGN